MIYSFAKLHKRFLSVIIDSLILGILASILKRLYADDFSAYIFTRSIFPIISVLYYVVILSIISTTPGKFIMKIWILQENGNTLNLKQACLRYIVEIVHSVILVSAFWLYYDHDILTKYLSSSVEQRAALHSIMYPRWQWYLGFIVSAYSLFDIFVALTNGKRQSIHDIIAKTIVIQR